MGFQPNLFASKEENDRNQKAYEEGFELPVANLQERFEGTPELSSLELQIMHMTLSGVEIIEIAKLIFRTIACVKWRLSHVYWKFNVENRLQLINKASNEGLHFTTENGIKQSFSINVDMLAHLRKENK